MYHATAYECAHVKCVNYSATNNVQLTKSAKTFHFFMNSKPIATTSYIMYMRPPLILQSIKSIKTRVILLHIMYTPTNPGS
jgi:hypothetical protein